MDWSVVLRAAEALPHLSNAVADIADKYKHSPSMDSKASSELAESSDVGSLKTAYAQGAQQLWVACDHMLAIHRLLIAQPQLSYSPWTCARGVLESCATCVLVLDPSINSAERITRSLNLRVEDIRSAQSYYRNMARVPPTSGQDIDSLVSQCDLRINALRKTASESGIDAKLDRSGRFLGFGHGVPSITKRIEDAFGASEDYSLLSAVAHGKTWAVLNLGAQVEDTHPPRAVPGLTAEKAMYYLIVRPVGWAARGYWNYHQLFGWDVEERKAILEVAYDQVGIKHDLRFWR